jgi:hypothetical protein
MPRQEQLSIDHWWEERPLSRHRAGLGGFFSHTWAFFFFASLFLVLAIIGAFVPVKEGPMVARGMIVVGLLGAAAMIAWGIVFWEKVIKAVDLYDGGVTWNDGKQMAGWADIKHVFRYELLINGTVSRKEVTINTYDGASAVFTFALSSWKKLADRIQEEVAMVLAPAAIEEYNAGEKVRFGPRAAVSRDGLSLDGKHTSWDRITGIQIRNGYLVVTKGKGDMTEVPLAEIANIPVFLKLLEISPAGLEIR